MAVQAKTFWRKLKTDCKQQEKTKNLEPHVTASKTTKQKLSDLKAVEKDLKMMNWLERCLDKLVDKIRDKTSSSNIETSTGKSNNSGAGLSNQVSSIMDNKAESDRRVIEYLMNVRAVEHECSFCSVDRDIDFDNFKWNEIYMPLVNLGSTILGM